MEYIKDFSGYSGCLVKLYKDTDKYIIRKISSSVEYNARLERQIQKQKEFKHPTLRTPQIYNTGYEDKLFYADMEYIPGDTLTNLIRHHHFEEAKTAIENILSLFTYSYLPVISDDTIMKKLDYLKADLSEIPNSGLAQQTLTDLQYFTWKPHQIDFVHGDLTLENIIVYNGQVYLIDFLDSFCDCIEVDLAKLLQDLQCGWSFRHGGYSPDSAKFIQEYVDIIYQTYEQLTNASADQLIAMLKLTLLRIYSYLKDNETKIFLDRTLYRF